MWRCKELCNVIKVLYFELILWCFNLAAQLVESTFLWKLHDLHGNEAEACDGIRLVPTGFEDVLGVKPQQYAFHCDAIANEVKLVMTYARLQ